MNTLLASQDTLSKVSRNRLNTKNSQQIRHRRANTQVSLSNNEGNNYYPNKDEIQSSLNNNNFYQFTNNNGQSSLNVKNQNSKIGSGNNKYNMPLPNQEKLTKYNPILGNIQKGIRMGNADYVRKIGNGGGIGSSMLPMLPQTQKNANFQNSQMSTVSNTSEQYGYFQSEKNEMRNDMQKIRQELDKVNNEILQTQKDIDRLTMENKTADHNLDEYDKIFQVEEQLKKENEQFLKEYEQILWKKKKILHVKNRLYKDSVVYNKKCADLELQINKITQDCNLLNEKMQSDSAVAYNSRQVMQQVSDNIEQELQKGQQEKNAIISKIQAIKDTKSLKQERIQEQQFISEVVKYGKTTQEIKFREFLIANKIFAQILNRKMEKQMKKFEPVEKAFVNIMQNKSSEQSCKQMITKFLEREAVYNNLQSQIQQNTEQLDNSKRNIEIQQEQINALQKEEMLLDQQIKSKSHDQQDKEQLVYLKELDQINKSYKQTDLMSEILYQWVVKTIKKIYEIIGIQVPEIYLPQQSEVDPYNQNEEIQQQDNEEQEQADKEQLEQEQLEQLDPMAYFYTKLGKMEQQQLKINFFKLLPRENISFGFDLLARILNDVVEESDQNEVQNILFQINKNPVSQEINDEQFQQFNQRINVEKEFNKSMKQQQSQLKENQEFNQSQTSLTSMSGSQYYQNKEMQILRNLQLQNRRNSINDSEDSQSYRSFQQQGYPGNNSSKQINRKNQVTEEEENDYIQYLREDIKYVQPQQRKLMEYHNQQQLN